MDDSAFLLGREPARVPLQQGVELLPEALHDEVHEVRGRQHVLELQRPRPAAERGQRRELTRDVLHLLQRLRRPLRDALHGALPPVGPRALEDAAERPAPQHEAEVQLAHAALGLAQGAVALRRQRRLQAFVPQHPLAPEQRHVDLLQRVVPGGDGQVGQTRCAPVGQLGGGSLLAPQEPEVVADALVSTLAGSKGLGRGGQHGRSLRVAPHPPTASLRIRHAGF